MTDPKLAAAVPANVRAVCATLSSAGHEAVTVGGAVRDALLGRAPGDWDVATSAKPEQVIALFKRVIPTGLQHGTVTIVTGKGEASHVEVTTFRGEGAYSDARRPDHVVFGVPLVEDLARRDLRVNAMAYDPAADRLIDPYNGQRDLADKLLRAVGPTGDVYADAVARFTEDGLRVMRAVRFAATLEFQLDPDTERGIQPALPSLAKVSKERISDELRKLLATREPSRGLVIAERTQILAQIMPEQSSGLDVWGDHAMLVRACDDRTDCGRRAAIARWVARIDAAPLNLRLAALVCELASAEGMTCRLDRRAQRRAEGVLKRLKFSNEETSLAAALVGAVAAVTVSVWTDRDLRRLLSDLGRTNAVAAAALWRVDGATALADRADAILARGDALVLGELALGGADLIATLELMPGPAIGRMLGVLLDRVLEEPARNTRAELIRIARGLELEAVD